MAHVLVQGVGLETAKVALAVGHRVRAFAGSVSGSGTGTAATRSAHRSGYRSALMLGLAYDDKDAQEMRNRRSGLAWTLARHINLTSRPLHRPLPGADRPSTLRSGLIARADVARYIVGPIAEPSHAERAVVPVQ